VTPSAHAGVALRLDITSNVKLMVGVTTQARDEHSRNRIVNSSSPAAPPAATIRQQNFWTRDSKILAFANADWKVTDRLTLSAGLRYTDEKKDIDIGLLRVCAGGSLSGCPTTSEQEADDRSDVSPRLVGSLARKNVALTSCLRRMPAMASAGSMCPVSIVR
jgi:outer membrane receptor protein involved in Fe transport